MHTQSVLQKFFADAAIGSHSRRLAALCAAIHTVASGAQVAITSMGRKLSSETCVKHRVKRMDRLVGNRVLWSERERFYRAMARGMVSGRGQVVVLIDWSPFSADGRQQLLRAALPGGGRSLTVYEELHPRERLGNRRVQHRFLEALQGILPPGVRPVITADAGFRVPFFRHVEALGWDWMARIRSRDHLQWAGAPHEWLPCKRLLGLATPRAQDLGPARWVRTCPLAGRLVLIRQRRRGRKDRALDGRPRRSRSSRKHARRVSEPWLLIASGSLDALNAQRIVGLYKTRMQIEEGFRDTKSVRYGLGIATRPSTSPERAANLLLIAALATFLLWVVGRLARARGWDRAVRVTSAGSPLPYSTVFLARLVIEHTRHRLRADCLAYANQWLHAQANLSQPR